MRQFLASFVFGFSAIFRDSGYDSLELNSTRIYQPEVRRLFRT